MIQQAIDFVFVSASGLIFVGFVFLQNSLGNIPQFEENKSSYYEEKIESGSKTKSFLRKRKK